MMSGFAPERNSHGEAVEEQSAGETKRSAGQVQHEPAQEIGEASRESAAAIMSPHAASSNADGAVSFVGAASICRETSYLPFAPGSRRLELTSSRYRSRSSRAA